MKNNILKIFRHYTKKKYKSLRRSVFLSIYGKIIVSKRPSSTKFKQLKSDIYKDFKIYKYKFYEMDNGRVFTDNIENVSIISGNKLLDRFSYQQIKGKLVNSRKNYVIKNGTPKFIFNIKGNLAILSQGASGYNNYAHCLFDIVPKIKLISLGLDLKKIDFYYYSNLNKYQKQIFNYLGIKKYMIIDSNKFRHVQADKILGVTHPNYTRGTISYAQSLMPKWIVNYLRYKFLKIQKSQPGFERIYIDRSDSNYNHCKIINNNEIKKYLRSKGFKIVKLSRLSFKKQIGIFKSAKIIIGPHGAGFANLVFCKKNTMIFEVKPKNHPNKVYERISKINNLNYKLIKLNHIKNNNKGDMILKKEILIKILKFDGGESGIRTHERATP